MAVVGARFGERLGSSRAAVFELSDQTTKSAAADGRRLPIVLEAAMSLPTIGASLCNRLGSQQAMNGRRDAPRSEQVRHCRLQGSPVNRSGRTVREGTQYPQEYCHAGWSAAEDASGETFLSREEWALAQGKKVAPRRCVQAIEAQPLLGQIKPSKGQVVCHRTASSREVLANLGCVAQDVAAFGRREGNRREGIGVIDRLEHSRRDARVLR